MSKLEEIESIIQDRENYFRELEELMSKNGKKYEEMN
jgi:hypothetical protein